MKFHQWVFKILKKQNVTDGRTHGRTDGRTDGQRENSIPPLKLRFGGGYNDSLSEIKTNNEEHIAQTIHCAQNKVVLRLTYTQHVSFMKMWSL